MRTLIVMVFGLGLTLGAGGISGARPVASASASKQTGKQTLKPDDRCEDGCADDGGDDGGPDQGDNGDDDGTCDVVRLGGAGIKPDDGCGFPVHPCYPCNYRCGSGPEPGTYLWCAGSNCGYGCN
jgi:hypothetical protein